MANQGIFSYAGNQSYLKLVDISSVALGIDATDAGQFKIQVLASSGAVPTGTVQMTIDPSTNGNVTINPNGTGALSVTTRLELPTTTSSNGQVLIGGHRFMHAFGTFNTFLGTDSGNFTLTNQGNTCIGHHGGLSLTSGLANTSVGWNSGQSFTSGSYNTSVGAGCMSNGPTTGNYNTGMGYFSFNSVSFNGSQNSAYGYESQQFATTSTNNTSIGFQSLRNVTTGSNNIAVGLSAASNYTGAESSNIVIGNAGTLAESNVIRIGTQGSGAGQQNVCQIAGIYTSSVSATNAAVFIDSNGVLGTSGGTAAIVSWSVITANQAAAVNNGYICNKGGTLTLSLPTTSAVGSIIRVTGMNTALGWQITQAAGQQIFFGTNQTTLGATGTLTSSNIRDSIEMLCIVANTTWNVISSIGNITVV